MLVYFVRKIDRPRSIYSKTVKGITRKDVQLDQKLVGDGQHSCNWPDSVIANEKKKMKKLYVHWSSLRCKCKCSIDFSYEKTVHR